MLHFLGRADTQIKSRGYRIELGEIEAALHTLDELDECAVVAVPTEGFESQVICCAYAPSDVAPGDLRRRLRDLLPAYMLPSRWLALDRLPKNVNDKIDRSGLRSAFVRSSGP